jgi:DNA-binding beta-propeller fold protein YncE
MLGFYLLNEGNMGSNKSTLDYFDFATGEYHRNIFGDANPSVPKELGDVGNDIAIYGSKLYAVINCSNKVEVMDKYTARRLGQINIPNCRYIKFHEGYAYITSYAGPVEINPYYEQTGYVAKVDTATFQVLDRCLVGFQPDELEIVGNKIYVANSGGYMVPNYENTVSVIDIPTFTEIKRIEVEINLHRLKADKHGNLWVSSRGDYYDTPSKLFWIDTKTDTYGGTIDIPVTEMTLDGDSLYFYSTEFSYYNYDWTINFGIIDVSSKQIVTRNFVTDGSEKEIAMPYGIMVNPINKDIYMTDAANYVFPGMLYCFDRYGKKKWTARTGDIPAHFAILYND